MKTTSTLVLFLLSCFFATAQPTNYTNEGETRNYNLANGDTLRITAGTFKGQVGSFPTGSVIIVSAGASFKPSSLNSPAGAIINYGTCEFGFLGTHSGFSMDNYGTLTVKSGFSMYDGKQYLTNRATATTTISNDFTMKNAEIFNSGTFTVGGHFRFYAATTSFTNKGIATISGDMSIDGGMLRNENRIFVNNLYVWTGATVSNKGAIEPKGKLEISSGSYFTNECLQITNAGFTNNANFTNNGLLWVGRTGTDADAFVNNGSAKFSNADGAVVRAQKFTNYGTISGAGGYYISGNSITSGTIGIAGTTTDTIQVFDVSRTKSNQIFDTQNGTVNANVVYRPFDKPDTLNISYAGCAASYRMPSAIILPVRWLSFDVRMKQDKPVITWSAQYEAGMTFIVEKSFDKANFTSVASYNANPSEHYTFTDAVASSKAGVIYYRIKGKSAVDGDVRFTEIKAIKQNTVAATSFSVYPNPAQDMASVQFTATKSEQLTVRILTVAGQQVMQKQITIVAGTNTIRLTEAAQLQPGIYIIELQNGTQVVGNGRLVKK
ncbi:T9SS type A sorting domain-containing protein [Flavisolibacter sp. BT320]|nr:T9SS type A sorting domain-containing protein [Flavisolibacter longurius]